MTPGGNVRAAMTGATREQWELVAAALAVAHQAIPPDHDMGREKWLIAGLLDGVPPHPPEYHKRNGRARQPEARA